MTVAMQRWLTGAGALSLGIGGVVVARADVDALVAIERLEPGRWVIRSRVGNQPATRELCVSDPAVFLQLRHEGLSCRKFVIENEMNSATVSYSCPGHGNGRTTVKAETPRLVQIEAQGIADRTPFQWSLEARRLGSCAASSARAGKNTPALSFH
jgi:hypothetical protein